MQNSKKDITKTAVALSCLLAAGLSTSLQAAEKSPAPNSGSFSFGLGAKEVPADKSEPGVEAEGFKLSVKTDKSRYASGGKVDITIRLQDVSQPYWSTSGAGHSTYAMDFVHSNGAPVALTEFGRKYKSKQDFRNNTDGIVFSPGTEEEVPLYSANSFFDMTQPGEYSLQVSREVPSLKDPKKMITIYSNMVKITIAAPQEDDEDAPED